MSATAFSCRFRSPESISRHRISISCSLHRYRPCSLSMNGSGGAIAFAVDRPVVMHETRTLPAVAVAELAVSQLIVAISDLRASPPSTRSGIIRLEAPIIEKAAAIDWLFAQRHLPRCYFSGRGQMREGDLVGVSRNLLGGDHDKEENCLVSVAGVGSAVSFRGVDPFSRENWKSIKRFLSEDCPLVRAYGAIRFDAKRKFSKEWNEFGSFYFFIPQVEFDEFEDSSMLATTIAWDDCLFSTWDKAVTGLLATLNQLLVRFDKLEKPILQTAIVGCSHVPTKASWNDSVNKALHLINRRHSDFVKVVLARCSRYVIDTLIDPLALLSSLQVEGQYAYQFYIQPPNAPAFIGNTSNYFIKNSSTYQVKLWLALVLGVGQRLMIFKLDKIYYIVVRMILNLPSYGKALEKNWRPSAMR